MWSVDNTRIRTTCTKNAQFISYLVKSGFRQVNVDRYEVSLRRRRALKVALFWLSADRIGWATSGAFTFFGL